MRYQKKDEYEDRLEMEAETDSEIKFLTALGRLLWSVDSLPIGSNGDLLVQLMERDEKLEPHLEELCRKATEFYGSPFPYACYNLSFSASQQKSAAEDVNRPIVWMEISLNDPRSEPGHYRNQ